MWNHPWPTATEEVGEPVILLKAREILTWFLAAILILSVENLAAQDPGAEHQAEIDRRISISAPAQALEVATPYALPLTLSGPSVSLVSVRWSYFDPSVGDFGPTTDDTTVTLQHRPDGTAYVNVVPPQIGKAKINVYVNFSDDEVGGQVISVDIKLGSGEPVKFRSALGVDNEVVNFRIHSLDLDQHKRDFVRNYATYSGLQSAVLIPPSEVKYKILPAPGTTDPIQVDPQTGKVETLQLGHAVLETTFDGLISRNCIIVKEDLSSGIPSDCLDIMSEQGSDAEGPTWPQLQRAGKPTPPKQ
jgi:hypothetical protein